MENENYIVATKKTWNIKVFNEIIKNYQGKWNLITEPQELTVDKIKSINPKYIFFPHWSNLSVFILVRRPMRQPCCAPHRQPPGCARGS